MSKMVLVRLRFPFQLTCTKELTMPIVSGTPVNSTDQVLHLEDAHAQVGAILSKELRIPLLPK